MKFVKDGYEVHKGLYDAKLITEIRKFVLSRLKGEDVQGCAVQAMEALQRTSLYDELVENRKTVRLMQKFLGPDVCLLGYDALWINVPKDTNPVLLKGIHSDAWTGTSMNTIFAKVFFTDVDEFNGMSVCPGSHLQGMLPVRNRSLDSDAHFESVNLDKIKAGDLLIWHPLLLHSTTGHSDKNIRISMTSRYTSTETPFSSQERALGYRTLSVGPMNQILRVVGNDHLTPLRTHGGHVGIDRRMGKLY